MNLVLTHCWKEWRSQRALLGAYVLLVFLSLCIGFLLVPEHWWREDGRRALALSWFVAAGVIGVVAFVAPGLVRGEFGSKDDQFVRRLPGALGVSFGGKALFLVLVTIALPLLGLACGDGFLTAIAQPPDDLITLQHDGTTTFEWPWPAVFCGYGLLLVPWVWAMGTWLPGGRMALGGTALFVLLLGLCVTVVLRQSPQIEQGLHWQPWLWWVAPIGFVVACVSWVKGRRGGGPLRSARFGLAAFAVGVLPPGIWLGGEVSRYHHPDPEALTKLDVLGITPDLRFVLATGSEKENWFGMPLRIDTQTGEAMQLGGLCHFTAEIVVPYTEFQAASRRYWRTVDWNVREERLERHHVFDLTTAEWTPIGYDTQAHEARLPDDLRDLVTDELRRTTPFRAPGGRRAWVEGDAIHIAGSGGVVESVRWPAERPRPKSLRPMGHGLIGFGQGGNVCFDLTNRTFTSPPGNNQSGFFVRGVRFLSSGSTWLRRDGDGAPVPVAGLGVCDVLGLFDDDHLLCQSKAGARTPPTALFLWRAADGEVTPLPLPDGVKKGIAVRVLWPLGGNASLLPRDPEGRIWLQMWAGGWHVLRLDPATRSIGVVGGPWSGGLQLLGWPDAKSALVGDHSQILRIDIATGERTVLFPRR